MQLLERIKGFISPPSEPKSPPSIVNLDNVISHLDDDSLHIYGLKYWDGAGIDIYNNIAETQGRIFSVRTIMRNVFRMSDEEVSQDA